LKGNSIIPGNTGEMKFPYNIMLFSGYVSCECYVNETGKHTEELQN